LYATGQNVHTRFITLTPIFIVETVYMPARDLKPFCDTLGYIFNISLNTKKKGNKPNGLFPT